MKLPVVKGNTSNFPIKALCPWCKKNKVLEPHSFAVLEGGALLMNRKTNSGGPDDKMEGFLCLSWHGAHDGGIGKDRAIGAFIEIVNDVRGGQFDLYFCSIKCLRSFLNFCLDELESKIEKIKGRSKRPKKQRQKGIA
jgi:hypothetical protein